MSTPPIESISFKTKSIYWTPNHFNNILLQNINGPCFLISLVNSLILSHELKSGGPDAFDDEGWTTVHKRQNNRNTIVDNAFEANNNAIDSVELPTVVTPPKPKITDEMLVPMKTLLSGSEVKLTNLLSELTSLLLNLNKHEEDLTLIFNNLSMLHTGLSINPDFDEGIVDTVKNPVLDICDKLGLKMIHGWLLAEEDRVGIFRDVKDYDSLIDLKVQTLDNINQLELELNGEGGSAVEELQLQKDNLKFINDFLGENATELTTYGLLQLKHNDTIIKNGEIAIFFRNNHFNTIYKKDDQLYLLLIDEGFKSNKSYNKALVWETLTSINGSTDTLLDGNFLPITEDVGDGGASQLQKINYDDYVMNDEDDTGAPKTQDELLLLSMQQEEDENYARNLQNKYDERATTLKLEKSALDVKKKGKSKKKKTTTTTTTTTTILNEKPALKSSTKGKVSNTSSKDGCIIM